MSLPTVYERPPFYQLYIDFQCCKHFANLMDENLYLNVTCTFLFCMTFGYLCFFSLTDPLLSFFTTNLFGQAILLISLHPPMILSNPGSIL